VQLPASTDGLRLDRNNLAGAYMRPAALAKSDKEEGVMARKHLDLSHEVMSKRRRGF
jgi:hypothetical protein